MTLSYSVVPAKRMLHHMGRGLDKSPSNSRVRRAATDAGHVEVDARGRSVWCWHRDEGESTSELLQLLENQDLSILSTQEVQNLDAAASAKAAGSKNARGRKRDKGGGFDPYNSP